MDGISPLCSTGHHLLWGPLPCLHLAFTQPLIAGQGNCCPLDALGQLVIHHIKFSIKSRDEPWFLWLMMILIAYNLIQLQFPCFRGQPLMTKLNSLIMTASQNQSHKGKRFSLVFPPFHAISQFDHFDPFCHPLWATPQPLTIKSRHN